MCLVAPSGPTLCDLLDAVKILPAKMVCNIKVVEVSHEQLGKGILFPFGVEASEAVEIDTE